MSGLPHFQQIACVPNDDSDQPARPRNLIRVYAGHSGQSQIDI